ncbi:MAG: phosphate ABC transporter substrate-binding protein [candidate division WOR-3 bacterium]|nr:phosphate ABC transporter substrate-binding protein [candidate division WOR-3 bacterium]
MKNLFNLVKFLLVVSLTILSTTSLFGAKKNITLAGSTTVLPIAQKCAEAFMDINPKVNISVRGGGSGVGIASLIAKSVDIGMSSRPIKDKELATAKQKGVNPVGNIIALDGLAIIVHPQNPINEITLKTLKDIYTGKITNWKALGGPDREIVVVSRDVASGTFEVFKEKVLGGDKPKDDALMLASNKAVATSVQETPGAIGYVGVGYLSEGIKSLKVDGIMPSNKTVQDGTYKLARPLFMYTNGSPKGLVKEFIDFILSNTGQKLVNEAGFVPINK